MPETVLEINKLTKWYKDICAIKDVSFTVQRGMVFGILGPNGSGKTTTLGILLGVLNATSGSYSWFNNGQRDENRRRIGALLETPNFFPYLTAVQNLTIVAAIKEMDDPENRIDEVLRIVNLHERRHSNFKTYSLGMKQRLAIASALLNDPEVLVLDEPTNGLDPQGIAEIRNLINDISKGGKTILIASHQLDEIEKVCTDVVILKNGNVIRQSGIESIVEGAKQMVIAAEDSKKLVALLNDLEGARLIEDNGTGWITIEVSDELSAEDVNRYFFEKGLILSELRVTKKSLEAQFLEITK